MRAAVALGCDYVELDVQRTPAGRLVVAHDAPDEESGWSLDEVLEAVGPTAGVHLDLKIDEGEVEAVAHVVAAVGAGRVVVTTAVDASIARLRAWRDAHAPELLLGLSTAYSGTGLGRRMVGWWPRARMRRARPDVVVSQHVLARWWLRRWARQHGFLLLVWTVDDDADLRYWLRPGCCWMLTTNEPTRALTLRP